MEHRSREHPRRYGVGFGPGTTSNEYHVGLAARTVPAGVTAPVWLEGWDALGGLSLRKRQGANDTVQPQSATPPTLGSLRSRPMNFDQRAYFDHNATTPLDQRVADAMLGWWQDGGNPSSLHAQGRRAREIVEQGRERVADAVGASHPSEIVFGSSGTELNNAVIESAATVPDRRHVVMSTIEHPSIIRGCERLEQRGFEVTRVRPDASGTVSASAMTHALRPETCLAILMAANNEVGTLQPVAQVGGVCREHGVPLLCDAVQAAGKVPIDVSALNADYVVVAGHKVNGPMGAAALWIREGSDFTPLLVGGSQERHRRASTENVAACAGLGLALEVATRELDARVRSASELRDQFERAVREIPDVRIHCADSPRLPNTSNLAFEGVLGQDLLIRLDLAGFAVSTGAACASGSVEPSTVLLSLGIKSDLALASLRVSFGAGNTMSQVEHFLETLEREVATLRRSGSVTRRFARGETSSPGARVAGESGR